MIRLEKVSKVYFMGDVEIRALDSVDLEIARGDFLSIMGPSGSGKSTLLNILGVLDKPSEGSYFLEDVDITLLKDRELAKVRNQHFGFIFQSYNLIPELTAVENVMVPLAYAGTPRRERRDRAEHILASVDMDHRFNHLHTHLSGGEQQRVAIARALATAPTLILADEPTGNLATDQGAEIMEILQKLNENGTTIVIVTHDPAISTYGKRLVRLRDGAIANDEVKEGARHA